MVKDCLVCEMELNGNAVIGIDILPFEPACQGMSQDEIKSKMQEITDKINKELPPFKRILKVVVRTEDFKRTGALKIDRNQ